MQHDKPFILAIQKVITENARVKSFSFDYDFPGKPGQFVMVWIPGYDEKPFGIVKIDGKFLITVAAVGDSTKALHKMRVGDKLGFRGPYGSYFSLSKSKKPIAMVAGGYGMASLAMLAEEARKSRREVHLFSQYISNVIPAKAGIQKAKTGSPIGVGDDKVPFEKVFIVGPEIMEVKV